MTKSALKNDESYRLEKALADAICHGLPISFSDANMIDLALVKDKKSKRIIGAFIDLYQTPTAQPDNKQIADEVHLAMTDAGYSSKDANKEADAIENLSGRKRQPNINLVVDAIEHLSTNTTKPTYLHVVSDEEAPIAGDALLNICRRSGEHSLGEHLEEVVRIFNSTHSVVKHGSKTLICEKAIDHKGSVNFSFSSVPQKRAFYENLRLRYKAEDKVKQANCFDLWMKDHDRKTYHGVVFDPSNRAGSRFLNMWVGFAVDAVEGDNKLDRILAHLRDIICCGNDEHFHYLVAWLAHIIQKPEEKSGVCVVLKSESKGTGKSTVARIISGLLGQHAMTIQDGKHLLGAFNSHLANKLFVTVEEAFWSGSGKDAGKFKTLITESTLTVEAKGQDAIEIDSYHRFMLCTNNDWAVPQTHDERRFLVLEVSNEKAKDEDYFKPLNEDIDSPEVMGQFFNYLKNFDIEPYDLRKAPKTDAIQEQIMESLPNEAIWLKSMLEDGSLTDGGMHYDLDKSQTIPKISFFDAYIAYCDKMNVQGYDRCNQIKLGKYLIKVVEVTDNGKSTINGHRVNCYKTKPLEEMNALFNAHYEYK